ncbi:DUF3883 domain-containing protein [Deinococcus hopiensis]|uniref:DUF3883 domain-containing protein n=1 Tax=Deinococcus hopiensis TaxID=309885 RepID=UPI000A02DBD5|nr:DUF3883 domain-containing protein [Deinococcus hopiensis]
MRDHILGFQFFRCDSIPARVELVGFRISGQCLLSYAADAEAQRLYVRDLKQKHTVDVLAEVLGLLDPADKITLDSIWSKSLDQAQDYLTEFGMIELPEEYIPVEIASASTATVEDSGSEEEEDPIDEVSAEAAQEGSSLTAKRTTPADSSSSSTSASSTPGHASPPRPSASTGGKTPNSTETSRPAKASSTSSQGAQATRPGSSGPSQHSPRPQGEAGPHAGHRSAASPSRQQRFRNYTYVYEGPEENEAETHAREVDQRGMAYVMEHEWRRGHRPEDVSQDYGAGYDITSADQDGVVRYIELKTMSGPWAQRGVALSANQYRMAKREKSHYWLYVIENLDTEPVLHEIQNPFERVTSYTFDDSWKQEPTSEEELLL